MQELEDAVSAKLFKHPHTVKDYADIMRAARKFGRVYRSPRWQHHVAHDIRVLQLFTTWMVVVGDAFKDVRWFPLYESYPTIANVMGEEWLRMDDYVAETKDGTANEDSYPAFWVGLDLIFGGLIEVLDHSRIVRF